MRQGWFEKSAFDSHEREGGNIRSDIGPSLAAGVDVSRRGARRGWLERDLEVEARDRYNVVDGA